MRRVHRLPAGGSPPLIMHSALQAHDVVLPGLGPARYDVAGSGPPVMLLHGLGATHAIWRPNAGPLAERYTVYAPDFPGHGGSSPPGGPYSLDAGVRFAVSLMDALHIQRAVLVGSSLGGLVALATAARHPRRVAGLALVSPVGLGTEMPLVMRLASVRPMGPLLALLTPVLGGRLLPSLFHHPDSIDPEMIAEINAMASAPGIRDTVLKVLRSGVRLGGLRPEVLQLQSLREMACPVLIVWGRQDRIVPVAHAYRAQEALPGAQVHVLPECGHLPQIEKAQEFNELLVSFVSRAHGHPAAHPKSLARDGAS